MPGLLQRKLAGVSRRVTGAEVDRTISDLVSRAEALAQEEVDPARGVEELIQIARRRPFALQAAYAAAARHHRDDTHPGIPAQLLELALVTLGGRQQGAMQASRAILRMNFFLWTILGLALLGIGVAALWTAAAEGALGELAVAAVFCAVAGYFLHRAGRLLIPPDPEELGTAREGVLPRLVARTLRRARELAASEPIPSDAPYRLVEEARGHETSSLAHYRAEAVLTEALRLASLPPPLRRLDRRTTRLLSESLERVTRGAVT